MKNRKKNKFREPKYSIDSNQQNDENEYEYEPINLSSDYKSLRKKQRVKTNSGKNIFRSCILTFLLICVIFGVTVYLIIYLKTNESIELINSEYQSKNNKINLFNISNVVEPLNKTIETNKNENENENEKEKILINLNKSKETELLNNTIIQKEANNKNEKIGVAFVYKSVFGNGIGRMLSLICSELSKIEKYDIYLITGQGYRLDFKFYEKVKIIRIAGNKTKIEEFDKTSNIKIYILQNDLTPSSIQWYQTLNGGKKVIGIMHGVYMSSIFSNQTGVYAIWKYNQLYDASVHVIADDYYVHKRIGINNTFFIPNMFTFEPGTTPNSNLTYNNLMIMGRELDRIKGGLYGIKAMDLIRKEVPDAKLYFISANYNIDFLENLISELDLRRNVEVLHYTENISHYFLNSSILLCPSLSEASPLVMNEGKAHGLPVVAFNVSYSPPYQKGVIVVDIMNYTKMAEESIKLLKDYNYRKIKGLEAKLSMNEFSNREIVQRWDRLFTVLINNDPVEYKKLQDYTYERYYDEEKARDHLETNWNMGKIYNRYFCCHEFKDMLNITYINSIKGCNDQSLCK